MGRRGRIISRTEEPTRRRALFILNACSQQKAATKSSYEPLIKWATLLVTKIKVEKGLDATCEGFEKYAEVSSSKIYDSLMDLLIAHLDVLVERKEGRVVHYNTDKKL